MCTCPRRGTGTFECRQNLPVAVEDRNSGLIARALSEQDTPFTP